MIALKANGARWGYSLDSQQRLRAWDISVTLHKMAVT